MDMHLDPWRRTNLDELFKDEDLMEKKGLTFEVIVDINIWAWEGMPAPLMRHAWTATGYIGIEKMLEMNPHLTIEDFQKDRKTMKDIARIWENLEGPPKPAEIEPEPDHESEGTLIWQIRMDKSKPWQNIPEFLVDGIKLAMVNGTKKTRSLEQAVGKARRELERAKPNMKAKKEVAMKRAEKTAGVVG